MAVRVPAGGVQINFHVAGTRRFVAELQNRAAKIRPAFDAGEAGMKNADGFPSGGLELVAPQPLMLPDGLKQAFGRQTDSRRAKHAGGANCGTPGGVKIFRRGKHFRNCFCAS